jgi:hypothetical protein
MTKEVVMAAIRLRGRAVIALTSVVGLALLTSVVATSARALTTGDLVSATGTLELRGSLRLVSNLGACPPGIAADACAPRTGTGFISGLGRVTVTYTWSYRMGPPTCPAGVGKPLATTGRLVVAGKSPSRLPTERAASNKIPFATSRRTSRSQVARARTAEHRAAARSSARSAPAAARRSGAGSWSSLGSSST